MTGVSESWVVSEAPTEDDMANYILNMADEAGQPHRPWPGGRLSVVIPNYKYTVVIEEEGRDSVAHTEISVSPPSYFCYSDNLSHS